MAAAVDFCPPSATAKVPAAPPAPAAGEFSCAACLEAFGSAAEQRAHCKSERHVYNTKRRLAGLKPISVEAWEKKLRESLGAKGEAKNKGTGHLKAGKEPKRKGGYPAAPDAKAQGAPPVAPAVEAEGEEAPKEEAAEPEPFTPERCLFDRRKFETTDECLAYMQKTYGFMVPDREYCTDLPGLLMHLWRKINEPPHACLFCNRKFADAGAVRRHMLDLNHSRIGQEARTRRGQVDSSASAEMEAEYEAFYDFHSSTREITERIRDPAQKVASLLRFFDEDRDGCLRYKELAALWSAANEGAVLSEVEYKGACGKAEAEPDVGLDVKGLQVLYAEGLADLDQHFAMLQDALASKLASRAKARRKQQEEEAIPEEDEEDGEEDEEDEDEEDEDGESVSSSGTQVLECDDEEEFEEVMRVLGLQKVSIDENGDLRLPNGGVAAHRDVAHIWKQRGVRMNQLAIMPGRPKGGPPVKTPLMLTANGDGCTRIAMSQRAQAREGKKMIAVLREGQRQQMRLGMKQNILQKKNTTKIRTQFGDASGGR